MPPGERGEAEGGYVGKEEGAWASGAGGGEEEKGGREGGRSSPRGGEQGAESAVVAADEGGGSGEPGDTGRGDSGEEPLPETENFSSRPVLEADEVVSNFGGGVDEVPDAVGAAVGGDEGPSEDSTSAVGRETRVGIGEFVDERELVRRRLGEGGEDNTSARGVERDGEVKEVNQRANVSKARTAKAMEKARDDTEPSPKKGDLATVCASLVSDDDATLLVGEEPRSIRSEQGEDAVFDPAEEECEVRTILQEGPEREVKDMALTEKVSAVGLPEVREDKGGHSTPSGMKGDDGEELELLEEPRGGEGRDILRSMCIREGTVVVQVVELGDHLEVVENRAREGNVAGKLVHGEGDEERRSLLKEQAVLTGDAKRVSGASITRGEGDQESTLDDCKGLGKERVNVGKGEAGPRCPSTEASADCGEEVREGEGNGWFEEEVGGEEGLKAGLLLLGEPRKEGDEGRISCGKMRGAIKITEEVGRESGGAGAWEGRERGEERCEGAEVHEAEAEVRKGREGEGRAKGRGQSEKPGGINGWVEEAKEVMSWR
ncbi:hypothetical protein CYMTET_29054 [Cymbomonas tetramitiformis]|uniref:Uncharacterized protein n=1 Tax=Cymbomonas tetramitiformis TaxID=36881 RepID=A0AAE0FN88_9CHLO|nr:hypothetical protein CYMTET_29054 [Cymbomonas tetramitiformis]